MVIQFYSSRRFFFSRQFHLSRGNFYFSRQFHLSRGNFIFHGNFTFLVAISFLAAILSSSSSCYCACVKVKCLCQAWRVERVTLIVLVIWIINMCKYTIFLPACNFSLVLNGLDICQPLSLSPNSPLFEVSFNDRIAAS